MTATLVTPVLVLNRDWKAIRVVPAWKALTYLVRGAAEAIEVESDSFPSHDIQSWGDLSKLRAEYEPEKHTWVRTVHDILVVPAIIRLNRYANTRKARVKLNRRNIYARDKNTCQYCGKKFSTQELNLDHVTPRCQGGKSTWDNLVCSCINCNTKKAGRTPAEANMKLIREPEAIAIPANLPRNPHASWGKFVDAAYWSVELMD